MRHFPVILAPPPLYHTLAEDPSYTSKACVLEYQPLSAEELWSALKTGERAPKHEKDQKRYYLIRKQAGNGTSERPS